MSKISYKPLWKILEKIKEKKRLPIRLTNKNKACIIHIEFLNRYRDAAKI